MIPIPGLAPAANGASSAIGAPAESAQVSEKSGLFGAIMQAESTPQTANAVPPVVETEGGNPLPYNGNALPALTTLDIEAPVGDAVGGRQVIDGVVPGEPELAGAAVLPALVAPAQASLLGAAPAGDGVATPLAGVHTQPASAGQVGLPNPGQGTTPNAGLSPGSGELQPVTALSERPAIATTTAAVSAPVADSDASVARSSGELAGAVSATGRETDALLQPRSPAPSPQLNTKVSQALSSQGEPEPLLAERNGQAALPRTVTVTNEVALEPLQTWSAVEANAAKPSAAVSQGQPLLGVSQPGLSEPLQATRPTPLVPLTAPPTDPEFTGELANRVSLMVKHGSQEASLQLNPPELGRMEIRIVTEGDQARVQFAVHNADARDVIEQNLPRLREMLEQSGVQLARGDVADQSSGRQQAEDGLAQLQPSQEDEAQQAIEQSRSMDDGVGVLRPGIDYYV